MYVGNVGLKIGQVFADIVTAEEVTVIHPASNRDDTLPIAKTKDGQSVTITEDGSIHHCP